MKTFEHPDLEDNEQFRFDNKTLKKLQKKNKYLNETVLTRSTS